MRRLLIAPAAAAVLLLAGCAEAGTTVDAGSTGSSSAPSVAPATSTAGSAPSSGGEPQLTAIMPIAPGEPAQVGPAQIDASAIAGGYTDRITLDLEGTTLMLTGTQGSCSTATAELLGQDATSVSVQLVTTKTSDGVCTAIAELVPLSVQLAEPLGDRTVVLTEVQR